ncbi:MAG: hypothetical protein KAG66_24210, partial [Methylococcales bacterium]|nr:hypothetical protein [Methylococcales bacterium]
MTDELAQVKGQVWVKGRGYREIPVEMKVELDGKVVWDSSFYPKKGRKLVKFDIQIENPKRWWPQGYGEANLYNIKIILGKNGYEHASHEMKYGLRTVELLQEPDDIGTSFSFVVNGRPIFAKGANILPTDFLPQNAQERRLHLRQAIIDARFNMLRFWGGGDYASDEWLNWCDENGILVWQDFIFAGAFYPHGKAFHTRIKKEAKHQIKRFRNHACMALWCGNNEIEVAFKHWGLLEKENYTPEDSAATWEGYQKLFADILPKLVKEYQPKANYVVTTPLSNWGNPDNLNHGSMHYWGLWHGEDELEDLALNVPRFMAEYGFQSMPDLKNLRSYGNPTDFHFGSDWM